MLVCDVMRKTVSVHAEETLEVAALRLKQENVGALPVVEADRIAGMITDRDILMRGPAGGRSMRNTKAREAMSVGTVACHDTDDLDHALGLMSRNCIHRLPVLDGDEKLVGVLSLNQLRTPSSEPAAFEVVFYKQIPNSTGHVHNVELTRVAVARGSSKAEAVQAAIKEFEQERKGVRWDLSQTATTSWSGRSRLNEYASAPMSYGSRKAARKGVRTSIGQGHAGRFRWRNALRLAA